MLNRTPALNTALLLFTLFLHGCGGGSAETASGNLTPGCSNDSRCAALDKNLVDQNPPPGNNERLQRRLETLVQAESGGLGLAAFTLPQSDALDDIPQDPANPVTAEKITLGQMLFHDNRFALNGFSEQAPSWSCSTCHQVASGFKPGIAQGIGEGGTGVGKSRRLVPGFDPNAPERASNKPDMQPIAVPSILNVAFQEVVLWNGQLGNAINGVANSAVEQHRLVPDTLPSSENRRQFAGIETQAIAGQQIHRLRFASDSPLQNNSAYRYLFNAAYPGGSIDVAEDAGKAIAAFERTVVANEAPFQRWLRGDESAMNDSELAGAVLFFGKAGCVACHRGPALSSDTQAEEHQMFFAVGFDDFDNNKIAIHGPVAEHARLGRGGFTGNPQQNYQFKVPQLYNLADTGIYGHGASFASIKQVVEYKNRGIAQNPLAAQHLDSRFQPLGLSIREVNELTTFLTTALYDDNLERYLPDALP